MERIKIFEDTTGLEAWQARREELNDLIGVFIDKLKGNNLMFDENVIERFVREGTEFIHKILEDQAQAEIKRLEITSEIIKENLLAGIRKVAEKYSYNHDRIKKALTACGLGISDIPFQDGKPIIGEKELNLKREQLTFYLENENQKKLWNLQKKAADSLNKLEQFLGGHKLKSIFVRGVPGNLIEYINYSQVEEYKPSKTEMRFGGGRPLTGNMTCSPDHRILRLLLEESPSPEPVVISKTEDSDICEMF